MFAAAPAAAQDVEAGSPEGADDPLDVYLVTIEPGEAVWEKFGHNAIRIVDREAGTDISWNWGIFDFDQEDFFVRLAMGRMLYSMGGWPTEPALREYERAGRGVWMQTLDLTPEQERRLQQAIHVNNQPGNRDYRYDYYRDNCSTRVRDHLDRALDGALREALAGRPTGRTYRWHPRQLLQGHIGAYTGMQLLLGQPVDREITAWEEGFLPLRLRDDLRSIRIDDGAGGTRPLVADEVRLVPTTRPPVPDDPPDWMGWYLAVGLLWAMVVAGSAEWAVAGGRPGGAADGGQPRDGTGRATGTGGRVAFAATASVWSGVSGFCGLVLALAWAFTDHAFWRWNENVVQADPLSLAVAAALLVLPFRGRMPRWGVGVAVTVGALSAAGLLVQALPGFDQVNGEILALAVPLNVAVAWGAYRTR